MAVGELVLIAPGSSGRSFISRALAIAAAVVRPDERLNPQSIWEV
jgi:hypothetical protein